MALTLVLACVRVLLALGYRALGYRARGYHAENMAFIEDELFTKH